MFNQKGEDRGGKSSIKLLCGNGKNFVEIHGMHIITFGIGNKLTSPQPSLVWNFDALAFRSCVHTRGTSFRDALMKKKGNKKKGTLSTSGGRGQPQFLF